MGMDFFITFVEFSNKKTHKEEILKVFGATWEKL
jgi:hypothetical protein